MPAAERYEKLLGELEEKKEAQRNLQEPDEEAYGEETEEHFFQLYNEKKAQAEITQADEYAAKAIREQEQKRMNIIETEVVLDEADIEKAVAEKRNSLEKSYSDADDLYVKMQVQKLTDQANDTLLSQGAKDLWAANKVLQDQNKGLREKRETADAFHKKALKAYKEQNTMQESLNRVKAKPASFSQMMMEELDSLSRNILKGKDAGHDDTNEFNDMKNALEAACSFLQLRNNRAELDALNENAVNEFKRRLTNLKTESVNYHNEKQKGIHWISSDMRHIRLNMCDRLQKTADAMTDRIAQMQELKRKETTIQGKFDQYRVKNPGKTYPKYTVQMTVNAVSKEKAADLLRKYDNMLKNQDEDAENLNNVSANRGSVHSFN